jgi:NDP-sugar pyrophosphorylase family protein/aminoglycoside/choline kinase family phosphotransferase
MKALILAAGLGTRLRPYSEKTPKPLFTIAKRPLLDIIISNLIDSGCKAIIVNTHHLHQKIDSYLARKKYPVPVTTRHEPDILGTGGAIKNVADFWDNTPFMVINSDIVTNIDFKSVYGFHLNHSHPVTLVLHNDPEFNTVALNRDGFIQDFDERFTITAPCDSAINGSKPFEFEEYKRLTFTGIQVLNPELLELIPDNVFFSIIDCYKKLLSQNKKICAYITKSHYWKDLGTPERYRLAVFDKMAPEAFKQAFPGIMGNNIVRTELYGDGSDRKWYRVNRGNQSLVMADHGIRQDDSTCETDAFVAIGLHLHAKGIPVPKIYSYDTFSGHVFMEDLGDINFQTLVINTENQDNVVSHYKLLIRHIGKLSMDGGRDFDPAWTHQTASYTKDLIIEKECRYFIDAFLKGYLKMDIRFLDFEDEFRSLADKALTFSINGFMHRDLQSRNIMVKNNRFYFIDFQGGRLGPVQYDLASLLIDPYVNLSRPVQDILLKFSVETLSPVIGIDPDKFLSCYQYCAITRNLQILGAFGFLSRIKKKTYFEKYIPNAIKSLKYNLSSFGNTEFPNLTSIVKKIGGAR